MLVQFSVENFKSIKEEQTISMVKNHSDELSDNFFESNAPATPKLLKSAVVYGANASGKSNLLKSLLHMQNIVEESFKKKIDDYIDVQPFLMNPSSFVEPSSFDLILIIKLPSASKELKPVRIRYGFSADKKRVHEEWLSVYPKGREQSWFHRKLNLKTEEYEWVESSYFTGQKNTWKRNTRPDQLFLSTAVHLNSEQLRPIYDAIIQQVRVVVNDRIPNQMTKSICKENENVKALVLSLLQQADINVDDIIIRKPEIKNIKFPENMPIELQKQFAEQIKEREEVFFVHADSEGNLVEIMLKDESDGTQKIFEFSALVFAALSGDTLVIDEFNRSLHPDLVRYLVKIFNSEGNVGNGQLIFTTHETSILRPDLLRRDQIWFCEKNKHNETTLYPLTDFRPRKDRDDLEECYLHGRYGGKPVINDFIFPEELLKGDLIVEH